MSDPLRFVLESGVCLALFYTVYWLFLKRETYFQLNRAYLVSSLLLSVLIPALNVSSPFFTVRVPEASLRLPQTPTLPAHTLSFADILLIIYGAGVFLFLARFVFHLAKLFLVVKKTGLRDSDGVKIVLVDKEFSPFSFFHLVFINNTDFSSGDLRHILAHERIHICQHHSLDILIMELVTIFQWFNPFVRPYKKSLQETHEYLADCGVIAQGFSTARYQLLILEQHVGAQLLELANNFKQSQIKRRLTMMSKLKSKNVAKLKLLLVLPLASFLVLAFANPRPTKAEPSPAPTLQEKAEQSQEEQVKKEKLAQAKDELKILKEKEMDLRKKLETVDGPEKKKELKANLAKVLEKEKMIESFLQNPGVTPRTTEIGLEAEYKILKEKETALRQKLEATNDPEKQAELKDSLKKVLAQQAALKAEIEGDGNSGEYTVEDLKKEYMMLKEKEAAIRAKLEKTEDPEKAAELKVLLEDVLKKQAMTKEKALALEKARQEKKK